MSTPSMDSLILVALRDALVFAQECSTSPDVCDAVGSYNRMLKVASCPFEKFPMKLPSVPPLTPTASPAAPAQPTTTTAPEEQEDVVDFGDSATDVDEESQQAVEAATKGCPSSSSAPAAPPADVPPSPIQRAMDILLISQVLRRPTTTQRLEDVSLSSQEVTVLRNCIEALYIAMPGSYCRKLLPPSPSSSSSDTTTTPHPAVESITALLDAEFAAANLKGKLVDASSLFTSSSSPPSSSASGISDPNLRWWQGDMSLLKVDAMVNPANCAMLGCFKPGHRCLDNILHCKSGPLLRHACHCQLESDGKLESGVVNGGCMVTAAFNLPAKFVFHTVGPCLFDDIDMAAGGTSKRGGRGGGKRGRGMRAPTQVDRTELASCYRSCLASAFEYNLNTIAFCCISTGVFGYPLAEAANIAVRTCKAYLDDLRKNNEDVKSGKRRLPKVVFNVFKDEDREEYKALLA